MKNAHSFSIPNIAGDHIFIGPTDDLSLILAVYCVRQGRIRQILFSRLATASEQQTYFNKLKGIL